MKRTIVMGLLLIGTAMSAIGQTTVPEPAPDAPDIYVVKKGDTLWDIAGTFFGDPFVWPEIWQRNLERIEDPHWIYPGQEFTLRTFVERVMAPETAEVPPAPVTPPPAVRPAPPVQPEPLAAAIRPAPPAAPVDPNVIELLPEPRPAFLRESYLRTGYISKRSALPDHEVTAITAGTLTATQYDQIDIDLGRRDGVREGDMLAVLAVGDRVKHPETGDDLGYVLRYKGLAEIVSVGEDQSRCRVTENFDPIVPGDLVTAAPMVDTPVFDAWMKPDVSLSATVLALNDPMISVHENDILYLDKGSDDGVRPGDKFMLTPRETSRVGQQQELAVVQAINVMPGDTAVLVLSTQARNITIGDRADLIARCRLVNEPGN